MRVCGSSLEAGWKEKEIMFSLAKEKERVWASINVWEKFNGERVKEKD